MSPTESEFLIVLVTTASAAEAERLAASLVGERLAACVNVVGPARSIYRWQGKVETAEEHLLVIKTRRDAYPRLEARIAELHSYDTPEIIALPIAAGSERYLKWLRDSTS